MESIACNAVNSSGFGVTVSRNMIQKPSKGEDSKKLVSYAHTQFEMPDKYVDVYTDTTGKAYAMSVSKKYNSDGISEKRKAAARAKLDKHIAKLKETDEKGEWVLEDTYYHEMNGKPYVSYTMMHYLDPETTGACMAFTFYCQV